MLGKLLKHELKATGRTFLPIYAALIILTILNKLVITLGIPNFYEETTVSNPFLEMIFVITMFLYVSIVVALSVMTLVVIVQRFYKNLFSDEGYLMFTLPVKVNEHILSKLLIALLWTFISTIAIIITILILSWGSFSWLDVTQSFSLLSTEIETQLHLSIGLVIFEAVLLVIAEIVSSILMIYVSITIGQLFNQHRVIAAFGAYIVISVVLQIIFSLVILLIPIFNLDYTFMSLIDPTELVQWVLNGTTAVNIILSAIFYFATQYIIKNKLNLE
ncbi:ABC transporter permease [Eubacteriaceae bacterium ES3]|nr:ABC transporter permease [Eubacteriaceae bacterium ES3]